MKPTPLSVAARIPVSLLVAVIACSAAAQSSNPPPGQDQKPADPPPSTTSAPESKEPKSPSSTSGQTGDAAKPKVLVLPRQKLERKPGDDALIRGAQYAKGLRYGIPPGWNPQRPSNSMRLGEMILPAPHGSGLGDGLFTVVGGVGGTADENVDRWLGQMQEIRGTPVRETFLIDGLTITQLYVAGTYASEMPGGGGETKARTGTVMLAAMVEGGPEGPLFFKAVGPEAIMEGHRLGWDVLLRTVRVQQKK